MALNQNLTDDLVTVVKDMTFTADNARDWNTDKIVRLLNRCLTNYLVPFIVAADEEFYITYQDVPIVSGQLQYQLPSGCHAGNLRLVQLLDNQGQPSRVLPQKELDVALNPYTVFGVTSGLGTPSSFYLEGNFFYPQPIATATGIQSFRFHYPKRPSQLVLAYDSLGQYVNAYEVNLTSLPSPSTGNFSISNYSGAVSGGTIPVFSSSSPFVGSGTTTYLCDVIQATPPYDIVGQIQLSNSQTAGNVNPGGTATLTNPALASDPRWVVGQPYWFSIAGTAPVVTFTQPELSTGLMSQWAACKVLEAKGDESGMGLARANMQAEEERAKEMLRRRVRGPGKRAFANPYSGKGGRGIIAFYT